MNKYNEPEYDKFIESEPGKTNWPDYGNVKRKPRHKEFYAVDVDGLTVCTSDSGEQAEVTAQYYRGKGREVEVRFVQLEEADFVEAEEERKKRFWEDHLYKPTPARTVHVRR